MSRRKKISNTQLGREQSYGNIIKVEAPFEDDFVISE